MNLDFTTTLNSNNAYHILVREWNSQTWQLGPLYEVKLNKNEKANTFSNLLSEKIFTHIDPDHLQCCKITVSMMKNFKRGELLLRRWNKLKNQVVWLGQSTLEINRDSVFIVVRD